MTLEEREAIRASIGEAIREQRAHLGLSRALCAERCGFSEDELAAIEEGEFVELTYPALKRITAALFPGLLPSALYRMSMPEVTSEAVELMYYLLGHLDGQQEISVH